MKVLPLKCLILLAATLVCAIPVAEAAINPGLSARLSIVAWLPSSTTSTTASRANINVIAKHPGSVSSPYNGWITVVDGRGPIYHVDPYGSNQTHLIVDLKKNSPSLNIGNAVAGNSELGVRGFAYHPDFANSSAAGYLKFYTMSCHLTSTRSLAGAIGLSHGAPTGAPTVCDNILTEWKMVSATNLVADLGSRREVLRFPQMYANHGTDALVFDPATKWLYIAAGDGGGQNDPYNVSSNIEYLNGKIMRINPLKPGITIPANMLRSFDGAWSYPASNPSAGYKPGRSAYYVKGMRHPETMFKNGSDLIIADIGGNKFEEINLLKLSGDEGADFGWDTTEGRLQANTTTIPPVAGYSHLEHGRPTAVVVGGVPANNTMGAAFNGKLIFGDIISGRIFYADLAAIKAARSWSKPMVPLQEVLLFNGAGAQTTLRVAFGRTIRNVIRVDLRLSEIGGTIYGISKQTGTLFKLSAF